MSCPNCGDEVPGLYLTPGDNFSVKHCGCYYEKELGEAECTQAEDMKDRYDPVTNINNWCIFNIPTDLDKDVHH